MPASLCPHLSGRLRGSYTDASNNAQRAGLEQPRNFDAVLSLLDGSRQMREILGTRLASLIVEITKAGAAAFLDFSGQKEHPPLYV